MANFFRNSAALILVLSGFAAGQVPAAPDLDKIPRPALPADPMELVTGPAQAVQDAPQRIAAIALLDKARELSNIRAQPYDLKTTFTAYGGLASDGTWSLQDTARGRKYRWTANGPTYAGINLYPDGSENALYSNQASGNLPLRLLQIRSAMFFIYQRPGPQASIRTASGFLNGEPQNCVLVVIGAGRRTFTGGRNWEEAEYCVDAKTGLLSQYSQAPGVFVRYDYSTGIHFHNTQVPTAFRIFENGQMVAEARTAGVNDPPPATDPMFDSAGLSPVGSGRAMNPGTNFRLLMPTPGQTFRGVNNRTTIQVVALHANMAGDRSLSEVEILASTDPSLNKTALEQVANVARSLNPGQPGATRQSDEMFFTLEYITSR